jgi:flap endonuclease-1
MGIRGLNSIVKRSAPNAITEIEVKDFSGKKMAIDCSILLYKYRYSAGNSEYCHIIGFINRVKYYLQNNITPVFVFDGVPPEAKKNVLIKRQNNKRKIYDKIDTLKRIVPKDNKEEEDINAEIKRLSSQIVTVKKIHVDDCKELLDILGVPYITAPDEAEKYCAFLQKTGIVDYTVSDDTDCLTFGCEKVLKTGIQGNIVEFDLNMILDSFNMDMNQFIDFCILSGCDYCPYIPQVGTITAFNLIIKSKNIETFLTNCKYTIPEDFDYKTARGLFLNFEYPQCDPVIKKDINSQNLRKFLETRDFKDIYISRLIKKFESF